MSQIIIAPSYEKPKYNTVFLAGGITNCKDWQADVINELIDEPISIFNPRREHFDFTDTAAPYVQIKWEFDRLEQMDLFSMYFCKSDSDQPICMYELGRNILRMQNRFPNSWEERIIISVENGYKRERDVFVQTDLCATKALIRQYATPEDHASMIKQQMRRIYRLPYGN